MTVPMDTRTADRALKDRHRTMWATGDYPAVAAEVIPALGPVLVQACGITPGARVLDVAAGSGNAAIPAALAGADVVATDLTPELLAAGERIAAQRGARLTWRAGDAEALPCAADEFDVVMSCVGVMFAPHQQRCADELVRVCRPGGVIGLINWTAEGFIGQMFATMKPYAAAPPPAARSPLRWGDPDELAVLFGDRVTDVRVQRRMVRIDRFATAADFRDFFKHRYGPTIAAYRNVGDDPARVAALDHDLVELGRRHDRGAGAMDWEYLLFTARKAG